MLRSLSICVVFLIHGAISYECEKAAETCETSLLVSHRLTMMHKRDAVYSAEGRLYKYDVNNINESDPILINDVITADGWEDSRLVVVANGTLPGPPIIVYEGQTITVQVTNHLKSEEVTIHWHGITQNGTPYMDGVPFLTQCPISPGQTFVYKFVASHKGTYWYHSHVGAQRAKGLFGALIVREKKSLEMKEHIMTIQEWNHDLDADLEDAKMVFGFYENRKKFQSSQSLDGQFFSNIKAQSGLINGRGRYYSDENSHNEAPLEVFAVEQGQQYRFRVIAAGQLFPWSISIDNHPLTMIATDGFDIEPQIADAFIINTGERYDFVITANQTVDNYYIRAKTLEINRNTTAEAILQYYGADQNVQPTSVPRQCTADDRCVVVNCFFPYYPDEYFTDCLPIDNLKVKSDTDPAPPVHQGKFKEYFLNFAFPGVVSFPSTINGRRFVFPTKNVLADPDDANFPCEEADCGEQRHCFCTHSLSINHGDTVQMIFLNMGQGTGWAHPVHMHGHTFYVLKIGYAKHDNRTGLKLEGNSDIDCRGGTDRANSWCNNATWSNQAWANGNVPGMELLKPVRKDTIIVPSGGYVITRIKADNPGVWFLHCHIELHANDGMAMLLNESFPHHPSPPTGFPHCHSYPDNETPPSTTTTPSSMPSKVPINQETGTTVSDFYTKQNFWIVVGTLCGVIFLQLCIVVYSCSDSSRKRKSEYDMNGKSNPNFSY